MRQKLALIILIAIATSASADPYQTKIRGDISNISETANRLRDDSRVPITASASSESSLRLNFTITGLGRFQGIITSSTSRDWDAYYVGSKGIKTYDKKDIILFKGIGKVNHKRIRFTGSFYKHNDTPYIHLLLKGGKKTKRSYYVYAPVSRKSVLTAKIKAVPEFVTNTLECGQKDKHLLHSEEDHHKISGSSEIEASSIYVTRIATDADYEYYQHYPSNTNQHIATLLNDASTPYENQLGFGLMPATQHVFTTADNPYTSTNAYTLLDQFKSYTQANNHLGSANAYHMFSGKDWDGSTVGLAYVGVICQYEDYSFGITQKFHDSADAAILAHEMGHNYGAQHDNSAGIMAPYITIPGATSFSATSVSQIQAHLAGASQCMTLVDDNFGGGGGSVEPTPTPTVPNANPTVQTRGKVNDRGNLTINIKVESIPLSTCKASLYASSQSGDKGRKLHTFSPTRSTTRLSVSGLKETRQGSLYLMSEYTCYSELETQASPQVTVNLRKIREKTRKSTNSLIGALVRSFRG